MTMYSMDRCQVAMLKYWMALNKIFRYSLL
jgi:hypothetical protein